MIKSMTGFGRGKHEGDAFACTVEVKSVNHRFLDPHLKLPSEFASLELKLKRLVQSRMKRGRLDLFLNIERSQTVDFTFNEPVLQAYVKAIEKLKKDFSLSGELDLVQLIRVPGIMNLEGMSLSPEGRQQIEDGIIQAAEKALSELERMRAEEGVALRNDILTRLALIHDRVKCDSPADTYCARCLSGAAENPPHRAIARGTDRPKPAGPRSGVLRRAQRYLRGGHASPEPRGAV